MFKKYIKNYNEKKKWNHNVHIVYACVRRARQPCAVCRLNEIIKTRTTPRQQVCTAHDEIGRAKSAFFKSEAG